MSLRFCCQAFWNGAISAIGRIAIHGEMVISGVRAMLVCADWLNRMKVRVVEKVRAAIIAVRKFMICVMK